MAQPQARRDDVYYYENVVIQVENTLFSVPRTCLSDHSEVFAGMFLLDGAAEGQTDDNPIVLHGYSSEDFQSLLKVISPHPIVSAPSTFQPLTKQEWTGVLNLSTIWQMQAIRYLAIDKLSNMELQPDEKIKLARRHRVAKWLSEGIHSFAENLGHYPLDHVALSLGWESTAKLLAARNLPTSTMREVIDVSRLRCNSCHCRLTWKEQPRVPSCAAGLPACRPTRFEITANAIAPGIFVEISRLRCDNCGDVYNPDEDQCSTCQSFGCFVFAERDAGPVVRNTDAIDSAIQQMFGDEIEALTYD
ncbi:hypothetical protein BKA70DRAFT_272717 [Coprinopsis sp. MPI-PUGE-AT-0042]|nr:hypothetical protein BKA70DRAFT_272717 [Coprinopsis sp. MPI-PUGE-AT-0042]